MTGQLGCIPTPPERIQASLNKKLGARLLTLPPPPPCYDGTGGVQDWGWYFNNRDGTCVTAEFCNFKKVISKATGAPELTIPDSAMYSWARKHGYVNGAIIEEALGVLQRDGFRDANGAEHRGGPYAAIDYRNQDEVQYAVQYLRGLTIGVNHLALENAQNGIVTGIRSAGRVNHCVGLYGYGSMDYCARAAQRTLPSGVNPDGFGVVIYTWTKLYAADWPSFLVICGEAWGRITDPDRGDKADWDQVADSTFTEIVSA